MLTRMQKCRGVHQPVIEICQGDANAR